MDYTTIEAFKTALITESVAPLVVSELTSIITDVSRAVDRYCTQQVPPQSDNYFLQTDVVDEILQARVHKGRIVCHPHKPTVNSVVSASYRTHPKNDWTSIDTSTLTGFHSVQFWIDSLERTATECMVKISYNGGLATATANLPADFRNAVTVLCVRFYKEIKSGLGDAIGVAELGTMIYTKAWPIRVVEMLQPYVRVVPW